ncbi:MAG TPA: hypothetical protein VI112_06435 [Bacteroidia bacterium]
MFDLAIQKKDYICPIVEVLIDLVGRLNKQEISRVRNYLEGLDLKSRKESKLLALFDLIVKRRKGNLNADAFSLHLYGHKADGKFRMIKSKLRSRILDALVLDRSIEMVENIDPVTQSSLKSKKRVLNLTYLYFEKGNIPMVGELVDEILSKGIKFENYVAMIEALKIKKYIKGFVTNISDFQNINKQIANYEYALQARERAADHYYRLITRIDFHAGSNKQEIEGDLREAIIELRRDYKYTSSGQVGYYLKVIEIRYFNLMEDYLAARNSSIDLLEIIRNNPSVYRRQRVGIAFGNIAECDVFLADYERAVSNLAASQKIFPLKSPNFLFSKELELKAWFYWGKYNEAEKALKVLRENTNMSIGDFRISKYSFYHACILFKQQKYKEALKEVSQHLELSKDKAGWDIALRVLAILCNIELQRLDEAAMQEESLRKHIDRLKKEKQEISQRDILTGRVLHELAKKGFMFSSLPAKTIEKLELLSGTDKKYRWQPLIPEMVPFHNWVAEKAKLGLQKAKVEKSAKRKLKKVNLN